MVARGNWENMAGSVPILREIRKVARHVPAFIQQQKWSEKSIGQVVFVPPILGVRFSVDTIRLWYAQSTSVLPVSYQHNHPFLFQSSSADYSESHSAHFSKFERWLLNSSHCKRWWKKCRFLAARCKKKICDNFYKAKIPCTLYTPELTKIETVTPHDGIK